MVKPTTRREKKQAAPKEETMEDVQENEAQKEVDAAKAQLAKTDLNPIPMKGTKNKKLRKKLAVKSATMLKIQIAKAESEAKAQDDMTDTTKRQKKLPISKPTMAERVQLRKLKKHDPGKAPAYEQFLADKYSVKKDKMNLN